MNAITSLPVLRFERVEDIKNSHIDIAYLACGNAELSWGIGSDDTDMIADGQVWSRTRSDLRDLYQVLSTWLNDARVLPGDKFCVPMTDVEASYGFAAHEEYRYLLSVDGMVRRETAHELHRLITSYLAITNAPNN